jgi:hypothetical protein
LLVCLDAVDGSLTIAEMSTAEVHEEKVESGYGAPGRRRPALGLTYSTEAGPAAGSGDGSFSSRYWRER